MTEKTEYITASIELLEKRDELNSDELAVLCNLKKFMYQTDHQSAFVVGEYYSYSDSNDSYIFKITNINDPYYETLEFSLGLNQLTKDKFHFDSNFTRESKPATAEQIATFQRAEHFASKGRKLDEFRDRDIVKYEGELFFAKTTSESNLISVSGFDGYGWEDMNADEFDLIQTAEELRGCNHEI